MRGRTALCGAIMMATAFITLEGCAFPGQNQYEANDVGRPISVQFGTVVSSRSINIKGQQSGAGALIGGAAGGLGGSQIGAGVGSGAAAFGLALVGLAAGAIAEQSLIDRPGVEYTVVLQSGQTYIFAQNLNKGDTVIEPGHRVMVQYGYGYMRVLPADTIPTELERPKGVTVY